MTDLAVIALLALPPGIFWLWYFYSRDKHPEPGRLMVRTFFLGMAAVIPAVIPEFISLEYLSKDITYVIVSPIAEECCKLAVVYLFIFSATEFDEPIDGIVYAVAAALGFATLENIFFVANALAESFTSGLAVAGMRGFLSVPGHALWAAIWGYGLGVLKCCRGISAVKTVGGALLLSIFLHAQFNCLILQDWWGFALVVLVVVPITWTLVYRRIERALRIS